MEKETTKIARDESARSIDADGRLHLNRSHISKAAVNPYLGKEIPNWEELGLQSDKIYQLFRDPAELEKAASTFSRLPILSKHTEKPITTDGENHDLVIGTIGSDVQFNDPYLDADLCFWDADAIAAIDADKVKELSCGYRYVPVMESGEYNGQAYDGRMTDIVGNHLALVEVGRAGSDVVVADHNPFFIEAKKMKDKLKTVLQKAKAIIAKDEGLDPKLVDRILDAAIGIADDPDAKELPAIASVGDESPADKLKKVLEGKVDADVMEAALACLTDDQAEDEDDKEKPATDEDDKESEKVSKEDVKAAMDSMRSELIEAQKAAVDVRPVVGDVIGMDSAESIYAFALDQMKVDRKGVSGSAALKAIYHAAKNAQNNFNSQTIAVDSAKVKEMFPNATRFSRA